MASTSGFPSRNPASIYLVGRTTEQNDSTRIQTEPNQSPSSIRQDEQPPTINRNRFKAVNINKGSKLAQNRIIRVSTNRFGAIPYTSPTNRSKIGNPVAWRRTVQMETKPDRVKSWLRSAERGRGTDGEVVAESPFLETLPKIASSLEVKVVGTSWKIFQTPMSMWRRLAS